MNMIRYAWMFANYVYHKHLKYSDHIACTRTEKIKTIIKNHDYMEIRADHVRKILVLTWRGSDGWRDWWSNASVGSFRKHEDVLRDFEMFKDEILEIVKQYPGYDLLNLGHSRGGLFATYCAEFLCVTLERSLSCITFGCPKPGNKVYRDRYNRLPIDHTNVWVGWDIVATMMAQSLVGFKHVGKNLIYRKPFYWRFSQILRGKAHTRKVLWSKIKKKPLKLQ